MSATIKDGGPAFAAPDAWGPNGEFIQGSFGMSLRDYFAAKAMQGVIASLRDGDDFTSTGCEWAYKVADQMIAAREAA